MGDYLVMILPSIFSGILGAIGGGWWMFKRKSNALRASMAGAEFEDVGELVDAYINRLTSMSQQITHLHEQLMSVKQENAILQTEIELLKKQIQATNDN